MIPPRFVRAVNSTRPYGAHRFDLFGPKIGRRLTLFGRRALDLWVRYVAGTNGKLILHLLPGYAPDLNPDELVWSHVKRTGVARNPLHKGEKLGPKIHEQLARAQQNPELVRSFYRHPSVAYISDL